MKKLIVSLFVIFFFTSCAHDTYSMSNLATCGTDQKPFKAVKPIKRICY
jgi:hypothetical protein